MNYRELEKLIRGKRNATRRKIANNTWGEIHTDGTITVTLHKTAIITVSPMNVATLDVGEYHTRTTMRRLNQFGPCNVYQHKKEWYFNCGEKWYNGVMFVDGSHAPELFVQG
jgi:hypothetical protein